MADDNGGRSNANWPLPKFRFEVDFGTELKGVAFQEISGLETETQVIEYRHGNSPVFSTVKMPGIAKYGNVTMKRGIFANDNTFWNWMNELKTNTVKRQTVSIKLLDESGNVAMRWTLNNAWPTKISSTDLRSDGNEVAVDTIEIAYERVAANNG
jgi:phage tail-like protein